LQNVLRKASLLANIPAVACEGSFVVGAPVQIMVRERAQHAARQHTHDPIAWNSSRRTERPVLAAEDQTETIVARTLLNGKRTGKFRRWTAALGQPTNGIGRIVLAHRLQRQRYHDGAFCQAAPIREDRTPQWDVQRTIANLMFGDECGEIP
jgi:hypothetical protein